MIVLIVPNEIADQLNGMHGNIYLDMKQTDGEYLLSIEALGNPNFTDMHNLLAYLPIKEIDDEVNSEVNNETE